MKKGSIFAPRNKNNMLRFGRSFPEKLSLKKELNIFSN
ncbi:hypothetical protein DFQ09_103477 [Winogradskyella pacifica]|uniref:Uncharacterized protein n=1 Tax=Winogradskyella pacifica TaxID=664642 RepID=A0A3D9N538_9FLAO|nr:hypothetical protein DFQ09_103477 [Winogradskyella pacifica]